jgi:hypothetical protein
MRLETGIHMKRIAILSIFGMISIACLLSPGLPSDQVQTQVAHQLTIECTDTPTEMNLPPVATLVPPAFGEPTKNVTLLPTVEPTIASTIPVLPTLPVPPTKVKTVDPNIPEIPTPAGKPIKYSVTGTAGSAEVAIIKPDGNLDAGTFTLPFNRNFDFPAGSYLSLTARVLSESGTAACEISSEGQILASNSVDGNNQMATCIFVLPD